MADELPLGRSWPPHAYEVGREKIREYAAAIGAASELHREHGAARTAGFRAVVAPPTFAAVFCGPAVAAVMFDPAVGVFDPAVGLAGYRLVQRTQRFEWLEPVCAGDTIVTVARLADGGERDGSSFRVFESESTNAEGRVVVRGRYEGVVPGERRGPGRPRETAAAEAAPAALPWSGGGVSGLRSGERLPELRLTPDRHAGTRYAGASGDFTPIHLDDGFARSIGLPGVILHGLYTYAQLARGLVEPFGGDPRVLRSLSARFRRPVLPERELSVHCAVAATDGDGADVACEVRQDGEVVLADGRATLVAPS